ncbi:MAG TPA: ATP-binding protein [Deltaproteobacteria bacterium]|nr:ATP-binding protein [Candidatus Lambdaproteobacteria bacterium]HIN48504.1 ATP-binding protein [Deltaproteobacteria bacterium]
MNYTFPFTAIVGLELAKRSLLYHAIDPRLGGLLLMGHRGCAKSTLARAFREILPASETAEIVPFVEVPLGTTEDRLLGSIDASRLLENGEWSAQTGLIQQADSGVLYIDEVNLLPDHLVDSILDSAASGQHRIERDGLSKTVSARYILIGSMNPEEGDLRPQLTDRFTHGIMVRDDFSVEQRREIVRLRMEFDDDPQLFLVEHQKNLAQLRAKIIQVRQKLKNVEISENLRTEVAEKATALNLEGVRAELGVLRTVRCAAAWRGETTVSAADLEEAWILCLGHRQEHYPPKTQNSKPEIKLPKPPSDKPEPKRLQMPKTSASPTSALTEDISLESAQFLAHAELASWWKSPEKKQAPDAFVSGTSRPVPAHVSHARLCWNTSLKASLLRGWSPGKPWHLRFRKPARRPNFWLFMDASRSTGVIGCGPSARFLNQARNAIQTLGAKTFGSRFHVLVLQKGKVSWWIKRGSAQAVRKNLEHLTVASGKSHLTLALNQMRNAILKQGVLSEDRVLLCSDGMLSPETEKTIPESKKRFRKALLSLSERVRNIAWLHPQLQRGMRQWLPQLVKGTPVRLIALD